jgi:murein DD-endopeptidase MepM/ murein hydrolase activator NlpD
MFDSLSQNKQIILARLILWVCSVILLFVAIVTLGRASPVSAIACPTDQGAPITSEYLDDRGGGRTHAGIDIGVSVGRPLYAAEGGRVSDHWYQGYQNTKDLHAESGRVYRYAHITQGGVSGPVSAGQHIGQSGNGNGAVDPHLHWEIRTDGGGFSGQDGRTGTIDPAPEYLSCGGGSTSTPPIGSNPSPGPDCHGQVLRRGSSGDCVRHLQNHLNDFGYGLSVDGQFGQNTQNAVADFQSRRSLHVDGVVGPNTWNALHTADQPAPAPTPAPNPAPAPTPGNANGGGAVRGVGSNRCLDVEASSTANGSNVFIWDCHGQANQQWIYDSNTKTLRVYDNKCLDIEGYRTANGSRVHIWDCHGQPNQQWEQYGAQQIRSVSSGRCLDVAGYGTANGSRINIWDCHGQNNQQWTGGPVRASAPAPAPTPAPTPTQPSSSTSSRAIIGVGSSRCLDVAGMSRSPGAQVHLWDCHGQANQQWKMLSNKTIQVYGNMCLDIVGNNTRNGADIVIWPCHNGANQQWYYPGDGTIRSVLNGKCLDVAGYGTGNGSKIHMWDCHGQSNQLWR